MAKKDYIVAAGRTVHHDNEVYNEGDLLPLDDKHAKPLLEVKAVTAKDDADGDGKPDKKPAAKK